MCPRAYWFIPLKLYNRKPASVSALSLYSVVNTVGKHHIILSVPILSSLFLIISLNPSKPSSSFRLSPSSINKISAEFSALPSTYIYTDTQDVILTHALIRKQFLSPSPLVTRLRIIILSFQLEPISSISRISYICPPYILCIQCTDLFVIFITAFCHHFNQKQASTISPSTHASIAIIYYPSIPMSPHTKLFSFYVTKVSFHFNLALSLPSPCLPQYLFLKNIHSPDGNECCRLAQLIF